MKNEQNSADEQKKQTRHENNTGRCCSGRGGNARIFAGTLILVVGLGFLLQNLIPGFNFNYVWPVLIMIVGFCLIWKGSK